MTEDAASPATTEYILEKWWHRLLRVLLMYLPTLIVFGSVAFSHWDGARSYLYSYSFEKDYSDKGGKELKCSAYERSKSVYCGELNTPEDFMKKWHAVRGTDTNKTGKRMSDAYHEARSKGFSDYEIADALIDKDKINYKIQSYYKYKELLSGFGWSVVGGLLFYLFGLSVYKIILYIVYGHTRIRKEIKA